MATKFFITGLPRSMTAWCANLFSTGDSFCYHDGLANCGSLAEFGKKLHAHEVCGDADSGLAYFYDELSELYPDAQWAVIRREPAGVVESLVAMEPYSGLAGFTTKTASDAVSDLVPHIERIAASPRVLTLSTKDLLNREGARALWWHCLRDSSPWNTARWMMLRDLRVTVKSEQISLSLDKARSLLAQRKAA